MYYGPIRVSRNSLPAILLILLPCLAFGAALWNGFVDWDDPVLITKNAWIRGLNWQNISHAFTSYDPELYIPLTFLSYQLDFTIGGLEPWIFHLTNLLLHIGSTLLFSAIAKRMTGGSTAAFIAAALFAVHPLNTETVVWAAARKDLLSGFFLLASMACWFRWNDDRHMRWYAGSLALFLCALLSKVSVLLAPLFLLLIVEDDRSIRQRLKFVIPFLIASIAFAIVASFGKETVGHFYLEQLLMGCHALIFLLWRLIVPINLSVLYPFTHNIGFTEPRIALSVLAVLVFSGWCVWKAKRNHWPLLAWAWFVLMVAPSFGNFAKGHNELLDAYITSDRYAYIAALSFFLLVGTWIATWKRRTIQSVMTIMLAVMIGLSIRQTRTWKDDETLWRHVITVEPDAYIAHSNLGTILAKKDDLEGAATAYGKALEIRPDAQTYTNLGLLLEKVQKPDLALVAYNKAVIASPLQRDAFIRIAALLSQQGKFDEAVEALTSAQELDPGNAEIAKGIEFLRQKQPLP